MQFPSHLNSGPFPKGYAKILAKKSLYLLIKSNYTKANTLSKLSFSLFNLYQLLPILFKLTSSHLCNLHIRCPSFMLPKQLCTEFCQGPNHTVWKVLFLTPTRPLKLLKGRHVSYAFLSLSRHNTWVHYLSAKGYQLWALFSVNSPYSCSDRTSF